MDFVHQPVLLNEVIAGLNLKPNGIYVDCTLGGGGHTQAVLDSQPDVTVIGIDQDPNALAAAQARLAPYGSRVKYVRDNFSNLDRVLASVDHIHVDGILMDIGVSSPQLDQKIADSATSMMPVWICGWIQWPRYQLMIWLTA